MQEVKRQFSVRLRHVLEPVLEANRAKFRFEQREGQMLCLVDTSSNSGYYFAISGETREPGHEPVVAFSMLPSSSQHVNQDRGRVPVTQFAATLEKWFRLVDLYKVFDYIVIMTSGGPASRTETVSFYSYVNTFQQTKWGYGAAIGLFIMVVGWASAWLYQKIFRVKW